MTTKAYDRRWRHESGYILTVRWDGNVWVAPASGAQYACAEDALRQELMQEMRAGGDVVESPDDLSLDDLGHWLPDAAPVAHSSLARRCRDCGDTAIERVGRP